MKQLARRALLAVNYIKNLGVEKLASWMTIIGFPLVLIGGLVGYYQLSDYMVRADVEMEFRYLGDPEVPQYAIVNNSKRTAEEPYFGFVIRDLDKPNPNILPIPFETSTFIKPGQKQGFTRLLGEYSKEDHNYLGTVMVTCKNCEFTRRYLIYINESTPDESFYFPLEGKEDLLDKYNQAPSLSIFPENERIPIK